MATDHQTTPKTTRSKAPKGTVKVRANKGRLSYVWSYQGRQKERSANLADTPGNVIIAKGIAQIIENDLRTGNFDETLTKYGLNQKIDYDRTPIEVLFQDFMIYKRTINHVDESTLKYKYSAVLKKLQEHFKGKPAEFIGKEAAEEFYVWLKQQRNRNGEPLKPETLKSYLFLLQACWQWAGARHRVERYNPWTPLLKSVNVIDDSEDPDPFTVEEKDQIIAAFKADKYYSYLADFVEFRFLTGTRIGEAVGLRWKNVSPDCSIVYIRERITDGVRKVSTKTGKNRDFRVGARVQELLQQRRDQQGKKATPDALVFTGPNGSPIDKRNFRNRAWVKVLEGLEIPYRSPNQTRHTFISHMLDRGVKPALVAEWTGHDLKTLFAKYARSIHKDETIPEY